MEGPVDQPEQQQEEQAPQHAPEQVLGFQDFVQQQQQQQQQQVVEPQQEQEHVQPMEVEQEPPKQEETPVMQHSDIPVQEQQYHEFAQPERKRPLEDDGGQEEVHAPEEKRFAVDVFQNLAGEADLNAFALPVPVPVPAAHESNPLADELADIQVHQGMDILGHGLAPLDYEQHHHHGVEQHHHQEHHDHVSHLHVQLDEAGNSVAPAKWTLEEALRDPLLGFEARVEVPGGTYEERWQLLEHAKKRLGARKEEITRNMEDQKKALAGDRMLVLERKRELQRLINDLEGRDTSLDRLDASGVYLLNLTQCQALLKRLMGTIEATLYFNVPVDPIALNIPHYTTYVKHPMDFGTVQRNLDNGKYTNDTDLFIADMRLVFRNCIFFNDPTSEASVFALRLMTQFEEAIRNPSKISQKPKKQKAISAAASAAHANEVLSRPPVTKKRFIDDDTPISAAAAAAEEGLGNLMMTHVRNFVELLSQNPDLIKTKKLEFFKQFMLTFDFK